MVFKKKHTLETKEKIRKGNLGKHSGNKNGMWGKKVPEQIHPWWKGDNVGYSALHKWVNKHLGRPQKCEHCGTNENRKYQWANKSKKYQRDLTDWIRLCVPCHKVYDRR